MPHIKINPLVRFSYSSSLWYDVLRHAQVFEARSGSFPLSEGVRSLFRHQLPQYFSEVAEMGTFTTGNLHGFSITVSSPVTAVYFKMKER
jgi:hypothetical protein